MQIDRNAVELRPEDTEYLSLLYIHLSTHGRRELLSSHGLDPVKGSTSRIKEPHPRVNGQSVYVFEGYHLQKFIYLVCPDTICAGEAQSVRERLKELFPVSGRESLLKDLPNSSQNSMDVNRVRALIKSLARCFETSTFQILLSFFEYCHENYLPLRIFESQREKLGEAIEEMHSHKLKCIALQKLGFDYDGAEQPKSYEHCDILNALIVTPEYEDSTEGGVSLSPLNHSSISLHGRESEFAKLNDFMNERHPFQIMFIISPSGAGKTRLVTQWFSENVNQGKWQAGFVEEEGTESEWRQWGGKSPECDTLVIVDYIYRFKDIVRRITQTGASHARKTANDNNPPKLRLIVLDHVLPDIMDFDDWDINQKTALGNKEGRLNYNHRHSPLYLNKRSPEDNENLLKSIIAEVCGKSADSTRVSLGYEALHRIDKEEGDNSNGSEKAMFTSLPLFAILVGKALNDKKDTSALMHWQRHDLISYYFSSDNRIPWAADKKNGFIISSGVSVATALQGLKFDSFFDCLAKSGEDLVP